MSKVIGIAAEGPTDYLVLKTVIDTITGEDNRFLALQPEPDMMGRYGNDRKGACSKYRRFLFLKEKSKTCPLK